MGFGTDLEDGVDLERCVEAWLSHADDLDLVAAALELDRIRDQLAPSDPGDRLRSVRLHLFAGDLARAEQHLALVPDSGAAALSAEGCCAPVSRPPAGTTRPTDASSTH